MLFVFVAPDEENFARKNPCSVLFLCIKGGPVSTNNFASWLKKFTAGLEKFPIAKMMLHFSHSGLYPGSFRMVHFS